MVYRKDDMIATTYNRKRKFRGKPNKALSLPQQKVVNKMISTRLRETPEKKWHDVTPGVIAVGDGAGSYAVRLTAMGSGTSNQTRVGSEITPVFLGIRGYLTFNPTAFTPDVPIKTRIMVVRWKSDDILSANQPSLDKNLVNQYLLQQDNPWSFYSDNLTKEFEVLYDAKHMIFNNPSNPDCSQQFQIDINHKRLKQIQFNAGANSGVNHVYLLACSDGTGGNEPNLSFCSRVKYTDL